MNIRSKELALIHMGAKEIGLDDDEAYRDMLEAVTGKRSAGALDATGRKKVIDHLKASGFKITKPKRAGKRPQAPGREASKARALWLALYHLGEVRDPSEAALDKFCKRHTGLDSLRFAEGAGTYKVIEHLKKWCARVGFEITPEYEEMVAASRIHASLPPAPDVLGFAHKAALIEAIWKRLSETGAFRYRLAPLQTWLRRNAGGVAAPSFCKPEEIDGLIEKLGRWLRGHLAKTNKNRESK